LNQYYGIIAQCLKLKNFIVPFKTEPMSLVTSGTRVSSLEDKSGIDIGLIYSIRLHEHCYTHMQD